MPVSFAAIVGGTVTLIGTSTNLVVSGLLEDAGYAGAGAVRDRRGGAALRRRSAVVTMIAAHAAPAARAPRAERDRRRRRPRVHGRDDRDRRARASPATASPRAACATCQGVYLVEVERDGHRISSVRPDEILAVGDRLTFAGNVTRVLDLQQMRGLASAEERHFAAAGSAIDRPPLRGRRRARVGARRAAPSSRSGFRGRYGGAGDRHPPRGRARRRASSATSRLRAGDVLLVLAGRPSARAPSTGATSWWSPRSTATGPPREEKAPLVGLIIVGAARAWPAPGCSTSCPAAFLAAFAVVALRILTPDRGARLGRPRRDRGHRRQLRPRGRRSSRAGSPANLADVLVEPFGAFGDLGLLFGVLLATMVADRADHQQRGGRAPLPGGAEHAARGRARSRARSPSRSPSGRRRRSSPRSATRPTRWSTASAATASATTPAWACPCRSS